MEKIAKILLMAKLNTKGGKYLKINVIKCFNVVFKIILAKKTKKKHAFSRGVRYAPRGAKLPWHCIRHAKQWLSTKFQPPTTPGTIVIPIVRYF